MVFPKQWQIDPSVDGVDFEISSFLAMVAIADAQRVPLRVSVEQSTLTKYIYTLELMTVMDTKSE